MLKRVKDKLNNLGNTFIVVLVSITCMSILIAAILATIGYYYRTRAVDLENKRNFYYVEKAMDDIYSGVGNDSINALMRAYTDTVEVMVYYDVTTGRYVTIDEASANVVMKQKFLQRMAVDDNYTSQQNLYKHLRSFISGIEGTTREDKTDADGDPAEIRFYNTAAGIDYTIELVNPKNLTASDPRLYLEIVATTTGTGAEARTVYDKLVIHNVTLKRTTTEGYVQSITTDIEISEPEFEVSFSNVNSITNALYEFSMIADMGVEFNRATGENESISITGNVFAGADYYNKEYNNAEETRVSSYYGGTDTSKLMACNGLNETSVFSGLYTNSSNVSIMAEKVIVPGTVAVINDSKLSIMGNVIAGSGQAELWADNIVMSPSFTINRGIPSDEGELILNANAYISDDMEINQDGAAVRMTGNYYGYNYSQTDESGRTLSQYVRPDGSGRFKSHYNSSAIIVNGNNANMDFSGVTNLHVAGRAYIEVSREKNVTVTEDGTSATTNYVEVEGNKYLDVQTGESISVRSNQIAYMPLGTTTLPDGTVIPKFTEINPVLNESIYQANVGLLDDTNPVVTRELGDEDNRRVYYFLNFKDAASATKFFDWYANTLPTLPGYDEATDLVNIKAYSDFQVDGIHLNNAANAVIATSGSYTSGALNVAAGNTLTVTSPTESGSLINGEGNSTTVNFTTMAKQFNNDYKELKYTLQVIDTSRFTGEEKDNAQAAKDALAALDSKDLTPLNFFLDFSKIEGTMAEGTKIGNYYVWVSDGDVTINKPTGTDGKIMGLIIAKGDVNFSDDTLTRFEGLVISGSKIKVNHQMNFIANPEIIKTILRTADSTKGMVDDYSKICEIFKDYSSSTSGGTSGSASAGNIEVGDILQYENWKKNIE